MGTRAAGGYVGMSEGWLGTVCALFLRSFNAATTLLKLYSCSASISSLNRTHHGAEHRAAAAAEKTTATAPPSRLWIQSYPG